MRPYGLNIDYLRCALSARRRPPRVQDGGGNGGSSSSSDSRTVLFVCVENSARSQMAEAFFEAMAPPGMRAASAGTRPGAQVDPAAVEAMREVGIDMSLRSPKALTPEMIGSAGRVVGMGCMGAAECPAPPAGGIDDWGIDDPKGRSADDVRRIRDEIRGRVAGLVAQIEAGAA